MDADADIDARCTDMWYVEQSRPDVFHIPIILSKIQILIVMTGVAGDKMWLGGLSPPMTYFMLSESRVWSVMYVTKPFNVFVQTPDRS